VTQRFDAGELPYGVFSLPGSESAPQIGVGVGDQILVASSVLADRVFTDGSLNRVMARGRDFWRATRDSVRAAVERGDGELVPAEDATMLLPFEVADFVDFNSSLQHATNAGRILRPGNDPVRANWRLMPVGYHGRTGTVVVSGTAITRPCGQFSDDGSVVFGPTKCLDVEAEVGFVVGRESQLGERITTSDFFEHVFGAVLVLDWSARDMQALESVPLGPFLAKSFATSVSAWVMPLDALDVARVSSPTQDPPPAEHLRVEGETGFDIRLELRVNETSLSTPRFDTMYWTPAQQLAHLTSNGARVRTGDLFASGTVSDDTEFGSLLELTRNGSQPTTLADGSTRCYLEDGDAVSVAAVAVGRDGSRLQFGEVRGAVTSARPIAGGGSAG
jgi:fumarylacetoacetase